MLSFLRALCVVLAFAAATLPAFGATITIVNEDRRREGFNDRTPVAPVGGNTVGPSVLRENVSGESLRSLLETEGSIATITVS